MVVAAASVADVVAAVLIGALSVSTAVAAASRDDGTLEYLIIDGQNRSKACHAFLQEGISKVRAGDVLQAGIGDHGVVRLVLNSWDEERENCWCGDSGDVYCSDGVVVW